MGTPEQGWYTAFQIMMDTLGGLSLLLAAVVGWFGRYHVKRLDGVIDQVGDVRARLGNYITREELLTTLVRSEEVIKERHNEHISRLDRIEATIDTNAKEAKLDRHELRNAISPLVIDVARLAGKADAATEIAKALTNLVRRE